jgi:CTD kinase subunit alpha
MNTSSNPAPENTAPKAKISFSIKGRAAQAATERSAPLKPESSPLLDRKLPVLDSPLAPIPAPVPKSRLYVGNTRVEAPRKSSPPLVRKEIVRKKRIKARPVLSDDHAQSESVYFRKPGNESVVGSGTYGKVYKTPHVYTGNMVALKKIRMEGERDGFPVTAIREIKLLQSLNHVNIVALREVMVERNDCFMVFEYLEHDWPDQPSLLRINTCAQETPRQAILRGSRIPTPPRRPASRYQSSQHLDLKER